MPWILLLLAVGCFVLMCLTKSLALGVVCMLLALVFIVMATMALLSARIGNATRHVDVLSADELRVLREQAEAKRTAYAETSVSNAGGTSTSGTTPPSTST